MDDKSDIMETISDCIYQYHSDYLLRSISYDPDMGVIMAKLDDIERTFKENNTSLISRG